MQHNTYYSDIGKTWNVSEYLYLYNSDTSYILQLLCKESCVKFWDGDIIIYGRVAINYYVAISKFLTLHFIFHVSVRIYLEDILKMKANWKIKPLVFFHSSQQSKWQPVKSITYFINFAILPSLKNLSFQCKKKKILKPKTNVLFIQNGFFFLYPLFFKFFYSFTFLFLLHSFFFHDCFYFFFLYKIFSFFFFFSP